MAIAGLIFWGAAAHFPQYLYHFTLPSVAQQTSNFSSSLQTIILWFVGLGNGYLDGYDPIFKDLLFVLLNEYLIWSWSLCILWNLAINVELKFVCYRHWTEFSRVLYYLLSWFYAMLRFYSWLCIQGVKLLSFGICTGLVLMAHSKGVDRSYAS